MPQNQKFDYYLAHKGLNLQKGKNVILIFVTSYITVDFVFQRKQSRKLQRMKISGQKTVEGKVKSVIS